METWAQTMATASHATEINPCQTMRKSQPGSFRVEEEIPRDWEQVANDLQQVLRGLLSGQMRWPLYLWGQPGRGKTLAALALCDLVDGARYYTPSALMDMCTRDRLWLPWGPEGRRYVEIQLLVLDEVGAGDINGFHFQMVKECCDDRELRHHRTAVYVSNRHPKAIEGKYDPRIASRMLCGTIFELTGPDRRLEQTSAASEGGA